MKEPRVEFQGWGEIKPGRGAEIVRILESRDGRCTKVVLEGGKTLDAYDCAWGRDYGEDWEHVTLNASPASADREVHLISTSEVAQMIDPATGAVIYNRSDKTA